MAAPHWGRKVEAKGRGLGCRQGEYNDRQPVCIRIVGDAGQGIDSAQPYVKRVTVSELLNRSRKSVGNLSFPRYCEFLAGAMFGGLQLFTCYVQLFECLLLIGYCWSRLIRTCRKVTEAPMPAPTKTKSAANAWRRVARASFWSFSRASRS